MVVIPVTSAELSKGAKPFLKVIDFGCASFLRHQQQAVGSSRNAAVEKGMNIVDCYAPPEVGWLNGWMLACLLISVLAFLFYFFLGWCLLAIYFCIFTSRWCRGGRLRTKRSTSTAWGQLCSPCCRNVLRGTASVYRSSREGSSSPGKSEGEREMY